MTSESERNIFRQFLIEEYEKRDKKYMDVVAMKRKQLATLLDKAHSELRNKSYATAVDNYYGVINFMKIDPYPDEFQLSTEMDYAIKCCFCYSGLMDPNRFKDDSLSIVLLDVIKELNDNFRKRLFPMYLLVLLNFHRKDWLTTLTWCNEVANHTDDYEDEHEPEECFVELLPKSVDIRHEVQACEEVAFFGYGEKLTRNALLKPRLEKYKNWAYKLDDFIASKIVKFKAPISDLELHDVFHHDILPIWCLANGKDLNVYYSDKFVAKCKRCMRGKLYSSVPRKEQDLDLSRFERYVEQCVEFYEKFAYTLEPDARVERAKPLFIQTAEAQTKKLKELPKKNKMCSAITQTDKVKVCNKNVQTEGVKTKHAEVQANNESQILTALLDIKTKCLTIQEKKEDTIAKLMKRINELQDRLNKETSAKKSAELEFKKKCAGFKFEIQKLKEQLGEHEQKCKAESEKNVSLQKSLVELISDKYNLLKQQYKWYETQASFMVAYLSDMAKFLTVKSIPNVRSCMEHIDMWERYFQKTRRATERLNEFYDIARSDIIRFDTFSLRWPEVLEFPNWGDNIVFLAFKPAIMNIVQTEEKLYINYAQECQAQAQRSRNLAAAAGMPLTMQYPVVSSQASLYLPRVVVPNAAAAISMSMPQYQPYQQAQQSVRRDRNYAGAVVAFNSTSDQSSRLSRSVEGLDSHVEIQPLESANGLCSNCDAIERDTILLDYVMEHCRGAKEEEVTLALLRLLEENKGTLLNISREKIVADVKVILRMKKQAAWVTPKSPHLEWHNDHSESNCTICFEEFTLHDKYTLPCQHEYHKECIKKWLKTNSVCPICRVHCVIADDFPPLY